MDGQQQVCAWEVGSLKIWTVFLDLSSSELTLLTSSIVLCYLNACAMVVFNLALSYVCHSYLIPEGDTNYLT